MNIQWLLNLHPATVHFPIGFLILASSAGVLCLYWKPTPTLVTLTWWPMLIGWISCVVAVLSGLLAQSNLPPDAPYWQLLNSHVTTGLAILIAYSVPLYLRWTGKDRRGNDAPHGDPLLSGPRLSTMLWLTVCLVGGAVLVLVTGWSGGELVYEWAVNVAK